MRKAKVWFSTPPQSFFMLGHSMATSRCSQEGKERKESRRIVQADVAIVGFGWEVGIVALQWTVGGNMVDFLVRLGPPSGTFWRSLCTSIFRDETSSSVGSGLRPSRCMPIAIVMAPERKMQKEKMANACGSSLPPGIPSTLIPNSPTMIDRRRPPPPITDKLCVTRALVDQF